MLLLATKGRDFQSSRRLKNSETSGNLIGCIRVMPIPREINCSYASTALTADFNTSRRADSRVFEIVEASDYDIPGVTAVVNRMSTLDSCIVT